LNNKIPYQKTGYFSNIINDYLDEKPALENLYHRKPKIENFELQIADKKQNFNQQNRTALVSTLREQYQNIKTSDGTNSNIELLLDSNSFTITTGHQLNLFSGPLYFLYKIITTIHLCKDLKIKYPEQNFIPIYWMATEDHDFEEINFFNFKDKKIKWQTEQSGPVGRFQLDGMDLVFDSINENFGNTQHAIALKELFKKAYLENNNLAAATRFLVNELFGKYGLVILDADNPDLKKLFSPYIKAELLEQQSFEKVSETIRQLAAYKIQVNPRKINLFYMTDNLRERIVFENGFYIVNNTNIKFTETEIQKELQTFPERFSPNVILRPLYQEVILPNLCYIGGGGELAYWLELKTTFDLHQITFPILLLRNSVVLANKKQAQKLEKLQLDWEDLFLKQQELMNRQTTNLSEFPIDFSQQKIFLKKQFEDLYFIAAKTDKSFIGAVKAQEKKQINGLENLEKRLLKAQKRKYSTEIAEIVKLQNELFPNQSLQERQENFSKFYLDYGFGFIEILMEELQALEQHFRVVVL
jgi:bacillithiol synthase